MPVPRQENFVDAAGENVYRFITDEQNEVGLYTGRRVKAEHAYFV